MDLRPPSASAQRPGRCPTCRGRDYAPREVDYITASRRGPGGLEIPTATVPALCRDPFHLQQPAAPAPETAT